MAAKSRDVPTLDELRKKKDAKKEEPPVANPIHTWEPDPVHDEAKVWTPDES